MSWKRSEVLRENLIAQWRELSESWNGDESAPEEKMNDIAAELLEVWGIDVEDLED